MNKQKAKNSSGSIHFGLTLVMLGLIFFLQACTDHEETVINDLEICLFPPICGNGIKSVKIGRYKNTRTHTGVNQTEAQTIANIAAEIRKGVTLEETQKLVAEKFPTLKIGIKESQQSSLNEFALLESNMLRNPADSIILELDMIPDSTSEATLDSIYPLTDQYWVVFAIDPQDTLELQEALGLYQIADITISSTLSVELIDSLQPSEIPDSVELFTTDYPTINPETMEIIYEWTPKESAGTMQIIDTGPCENYICLWTSGTYNGTNTWDWTDTDFDYTIGPSGDLEVEVINALCDWKGGLLTTAHAFYYPATEKKALNYDLFGSISWGYIPSLPTGWCWMLMSDYSWSGIPHSHGISVALDWASAFNCGEGIPPLAGVCGWPLVGNPPPPFDVHGILGSSIPLTSPLSYTEPNEYRFHIIAVPEVNIRNKAKKSSNTR